MVLPVNIDTTYADDATDASVKLHQQHHDTIHAAVNGLPSFLPSVYGAAGDGTTDDTTALNNCIAAAVAVKGRVLLAANTTYKITTALVVTGSCIIEGQGSTEVGFDGNMPLTSPFLAGSVIRQDGAGQDGIQITGTSPTVNLRDFAVVFGTNKFSNTGHGINAQPTATNGTGHEFGLQNSLWENVKVFGHDGNHYGRRIVNGLLNTFTNCRSYGGGVVEHVGDRPGAILGNAVETHPFGVVLKSGTAHGYAFTAAAAPGAAPNGQVNLITFVRPQVNMLDYSGTTALGNPVKPTISQYMWQAAAGAFEGSAISAIDPDFESSDSVQHPVNFGTTSAGNMVRNGGAILMGGGNMPFFRSGSGTGFNSSPSVTAGTGAGTGATVGTGATIGGGPAATDLGGLINITTGTAPAARLNKVCTVTFAHLTYPLAITLTAMNDNAAQLQWFPTNITSTSFDIMCETQLGASGWLYQLLYTVIPAYP